MPRFRLTIGTNQRNRKSGGPRFYTILILPHARSRFRRLHVSRNFVATVGALALVVGAAALVAPHLLFRSHTQSAALAALHEENDQLRDERERYQAALDDMSQRLAEFEDETGRLARELGLDDLPTDEPAAGGPVDDPTGSIGARRTSPLDDTLAGLTRRSEAIDGSLEALDDAFQTRMRLLSSTPDGMPTEGWFSHGYGWRKDPFTGKRQFHRGIDIVNHHGTEILVSADGVVSRARRTPDYGKVVDVSHGHGYVTRYAHLSEILVRPGERVSRGALLGRMGSTGRSTGPHLHYEVFRDGRRVNPWKYLGYRGD